MKKIISEKIKLLRSGALSEEDFLSFLENFPYYDLGDLKLDFHRKLRRGLPEVIYGSGKTLDHLERIITKFGEMGEQILITRINPQTFTHLKKSFSDLIYHEKGQIVTFTKEPDVLFKGKILVLSAGSSDENVAEEAFISAYYLGNAVDREYDVGVACISRILDLRKKLNNYSVVIVVAGMEGALPSIVAGLTSSPIIAVPTSVGYGANFAGLAALLSMLNSCSGGVSVVNINNGFGAAYQAALINQKIDQFLKK